MKEFHLGIAVICLVLVVFVILELCLYCDRRRVRKGREVQLRGEGELSEGGIETVPLLDTSPGIVWGRSSLQPPRRKGLATQAVLVTEHVGEFIRQPTSTRTGRETGWRRSRITAENDDEFTQRGASSSREQGAEVRLVDTSTRSPPPRLSIVIPTTGQQGHFASTHINPMSYTPPPAYQPPSTDYRVSQPSAIISRSIDPSPAQVPMQPTRPQTISASTLASLLSHTGMPRSASPPAYSDLITPYPEGMTGLGSHGRFPY